MDHTQNEYNNNSTQELPKPNGGIKKRHPNYGVV